VNWTVWRWARKQSRGKYTPNRIAFEWAKTATSKSQDIANRKAKGLGLFHNHVAITSDGRPPSWNPNEPHNHKIDGICSPVAATSSS